MGREARRNAAEGKKFDCGDCLAFCCAVYPAVSVDDRDARRLAAHFDLPLMIVLDLHTTTLVEGGKSSTILKRKFDPAFGECCTFLDTTARRCTIYDARPDVCREFPSVRAAPPGAEGRCCYYDTYRYLRNEAGDPDLVPLVKIMRRLRDD